MRLRSTRKKMRLSVLVPAGYMRVLRTEADLYGLTISQFAEQLLRHSVGLPGLTPRPKDAPQYELGEHELRQRYHFVWYMSADLESALASARLVLGAANRKMWLVHAVNVWLGRDGIAASSSVAA
jgi:hypothetical protein